MDEWVDGITAVAAALSLTGRYEDELEAPQTSPTRPKNTVKWILDSEPPFTRIDLDTC